MSKNLIFLFIVLTASFTACKKDKSHTSVLGSWNCEEFSDLFTKRIYQVSITRYPYIAGATDEYIISNFYNLGITENNDVYVKEIEPGILTITGTSNITILITGTGMVAEDFSRIEWDFQVNDGGSNPHVIATYY